MPPLPVSYRGTQHPLQEQLKDRVIPSCKACWDQALPTHLDTGALPFLSNTGCQPCDPVYVFSVFPGKK
jgi:hypothetical protein